MAYQFNIYAILLTILAIPLIWIIHLAWRQRNELVPRTFLIFVILSLGLVLAYAGELFSTELRQIMLWLRLEYMFHAALLAYLVFALAYAGYTELIKPLPIASALIVPIFIWVGVWTNDQHHLVWEYTGTRIVNGLVMFDRTYGPLFWVWIIYLNTMSGIAALVLIRAAFRKSNIYRGQIAMILLGTSIPWIGLFLTITRLTPFPLLDLVPYGVAIQGIPIAYGLFHFRFLDLLPIIYRQITERTSDIMLVYDSQERVLEANEAALGFLKLPVQSVIGKPLSSLVPAPMYIDHAVHEETVRSVTLEGGPAHAFEMRTIPIFNRSNTAHSYVMLVRDQTQLRLAEERQVTLEIEHQRNELLEEFLLRISHDFRTRLTVITSIHFLIARLLEQGNTRLAELSPNIPATSTDTLESIVGTLKRAGAKLKTSETSAFEMAKILDNMFEVIRLKYQLEFSFEPISLETVANEEISRVCASFAHKNINLTIASDSGLPNIFVDQAEIRLLINHLLENAFQFTSAGGQIAVRLALEEKEALIEVSDDGVGIGSDDLPHVFEGLYRADKARQTDTGGAGLGLTIVKRVVDTHFGHIAVDSTPGAGSTFRVYLPLAHMN